MSRLKAQKHLISGALALIFSIVALMSWSVSSPVAASPDEGYHLATIWCANGESIGHCEINEKGKPKVPSEVFSWCYQHKPLKDASCTNQLKSQGLVEAGSFITSASNFQKFQELFSGEPVPTHVIVIRIMTSILIISIVFVVGILSNLRNRLALVFTIGIFFVPHGIYLLSMGHPSGVISFLVVVTSLLFNQMFDSDMSKAKRILMSFLILLFSLIMYDVRPEGIIFFFIIASLLFLHKVSEHKSWSYKKKLKALSFVFIAAPTLLFSLFWLFPGKVPLTFHVFTVVQGTGRAWWSVLTTNIENFPSLYLGNFGYWGLGAIDVPLPSIVWFIISAAVFGLIAIGLQFSSRANVIFFLTSSLAYVVILILILQQSLLYVGEELQPRYLLPLAAGLFATFIANARPERPSNLRILLCVLVFLVSSANSISLWKTLRRYTSGNVSGEPDLNFNRKWWWDFALDPNQVWFIGTISFGIALSLAIAVAINSRQTVKAGLIEKISK